jgi:hypothetical protein
MVVFRVGPDPSRAPDLKTTERVLRPVVACDILGSVWNEISIESAPYPPAHPDRLVHKASRVAVGMAGV